MAKTAKGLVEYAKAQLGKPYWYGTFGQAASKNVYDQKKRQYSEYYKWVYTPDVAGVKVHDCVGLIKGYIWCDNPTDSVPKYNGIQDLSANMMRSACKVSGSMSVMPEKPGLLVFMDHHVGVYIGNSEVIEARGHNYGVVKTKLADRKWTSWGECPYVSYEEYATKEEPTKTTSVKTVSIDMMILRQGENRGNAQIKTLQALLKTFGYYSMDVDGSFGPGTKKAVEAFQKAKKLEVDGVVGKNTWTKLLKG